MFIYTTDELTEICAVTGEDLTEIELLVVSN